MSPVRDNYCPDHVIFKGTTKPHHNTSIRSGMNRITTLFAILEADCRECGTTFPKIAIDWKNEDTRWCDVMDCGDTEHLTTKPVLGSALFWKNLHADGEGDSRVLHAGLSVKSGVRVGLNIWSRTQVSTAVPEADPDNIVQDSFKLMSLL
jgi:hypothetical protein